MKMRRRGDNLSTRFEKTVWAKKNELLVKEALDGVERSIAIVVARTRNAGLFNRDTTRKCILIGLKAALARPLPEGF